MVCTMLVLLLRTGDGIGIANMALPSTSLSVSRGSSSSTSSSSSIPGGAVKSTAILRPAYSRLHYLQCALAGALSCSTTHALMVPMDVIKTRIQTDLTRGPPMTIHAAYKTIVQRGGAQALLQGFTAIYSGYFVQGAAKFGFYELFKHKISAALERAGVVAVDTRLHLPIYIASSGLAEVIASVALTPMEVTKIDMMTNPLSKGRGMLSAMRAIVQTGGVKALFRGLPLIMLRQVPYTCVKLAGYDIIIESLRRKFAPEEISGAEGGVGRRDLQLLSGVLAGVLAATISHPADVMLSKLCGGTQALTECIIVQSPGDVMRLFREIGLRGCFKGLEARAIMTAAMTAGQFAIYEQAKIKIKSFSS